MSAAQHSATYSYTWVADQFGHICLGLIGNFAATALCGVVMTLFGGSSEFHYDTGKWPGLVIVSVGAAVWEWFAYSKSADEATKLPARQSLVAGQHEPDAKTLHNLIQRGAPPDIDPCQIVIGGPIGAGRTSMAPELEPSLRSKITKSVMSAWMRCLSLQ